MSFERDLLLSQSPKAHRIYMAALMSRWPSVSGIHYLTDRGIQPQHQVGETDAAVVFNTGSCALLELKLRDSYYPDLCLEYVSNQGTGSPGWIAKPTAAEFLLYAWADGRAKIYACPVLWWLWSRKGAEWVAKAQARKDGFRIAGGDHSLCACVPFRVLDPAYDKLLNLAAPCTYPPTT